MSRSHDSSDSSSRRRLLANFFRALSDPQRLHILELLVAHNEMSVTAICDQLQQSQPAVSHHLTQLRAAGLIEFRRDGKFHYYRIDNERLWAIVNDFRSDSAGWGFGSFQIQIEKSV